MCVSGSITRLSFLRLALRGCGCGLLLIAFLAIHAGATAASSPSPHLGVALPLASPVAGDHHTTTSATADPATGRLLILMAGTPEAEEDPQPALRRMMLPRDRQAHARASRLALSPDSRRTTYQARAPPVPV